VSAAGVISNGVGVVPTGVTIVANRYDYTFPVGTVVRGVILASQSKLYGYQVGASFNNLVSVSFSTDAGVVTATAHNCVFW
jgi:hypothetical protein